MNIWIEASRPKTLPAAIAPVLLASSLAWANDCFAYPQAILCLLFALLIQIGTNFANDYYDFIKGADTHERKGPRRAVAAGLVSPGKMKRVTLFTFSASLLVGLPLCYWGGKELILIGLLSVICGYAYTGGPYPLAYKGCADIFVFIFFGIIAVTFSYYVQSATFTWDSFWLSLCPGALATNILVVNNYRDYETDKKANKLSLIVRFGSLFGLREYSLNLFIAYTVPCYLSIQYQSFWLLLPLLSLPLAIKLLKEMATNKEREKLNKVLAKTAGLMLLHSLLLSLALLMV